MDKKKVVAVFFNSPALGGAERSMILQVEKMEGVSPCFFIPYIYSEKEAQDLVDFVGVKFPSATLHLFPFSPELYSFGRNKSYSLFLRGLSVLMGFMDIYLTLRSLGPHRYPIIWANGNKVAFPLFLYLSIKRYRGKLIWHFRDYPSSRWPFGLIWKLVRFFEVPRTLFVGNSDSVCKAIKEVVSTNHEVYRVYNPSGLAAQGTQKEFGGVIGVVGMLARWKGQDQLIRLCDKFGDKLYARGYREVRLYGGSIYYTDQGRDSFEGELKELAESIDSPIKIKFCGLCPPAQIFSEIDVLVHSSVEPEPFGRVIVEAFQSEVPVISTSLGGASELVTHNVSGLVFAPHDLESLEEQLSSLCKDELKSDLVSRAKGAAKKVEESITASIREVLDV